MPSRALLPSLLLLALARTATSLSVAAPPPAPLNIATAQYLSDYPMALSLDGTPGYYYIRKSTSAANASKWVVHIQGGGWCDSLDSCKSRSESNLGSSAHNKTKEQDIQDLNTVHGCENNRWCGALMVNDPAINPVAHDWNAVLLRYTDGASWIGDLAEPVTHDGTKLYFRGRYNLEATFADLQVKHGLGAASAVLIGGDSAGGLATFLHIDKMSDMIHAANAAKGAPRADVLGMPDSGFWPDDQGFSKYVRAMFYMQTNGTADAAGLPKHCQARASNVTQCLFPQYFADQIKTRLWPLQSIYDPLQKGKDPQTHGQWLLDNLNRTVFSTVRKDGRANGGWVHSCERHCGAELLTIDGTHAPAAVASFLATSEGEVVDAGADGDRDADAQRTQKKQTVWLQQKSYPCTTCCNDQT